MRRPYQLIRQRRREAVIKWASQSFAGGGTLRMFKKKSTADIRKFLRRNIGDCRTLAPAHTQDAYDRELFRLIRRLQERLRLNKRSKGRPARFGQAAKLINLYIKQFLLYPDFMSFPCRRRNLYKFAHVPLDRIVLRHMWKDFPHEMNGIRPRLAVGDLSPEIYQTLQSILRNAARADRMLPLAYDFRWADREQ